MAEDRSIPLGYVVGRSLAALAVSNTAESGLYEDPFNTESPEDDYGSAFAWPASTGAVVLLSTPKSGSLTVSAPLGVDISLSTTQFLNRNETHFARTALLRVAPHIDIPPLISRRDWVAQIGTAVTSTGQLTFSGIHRDEQHGFPVLGHAPILRLSSLNDCVSHLFAGSDLPYARELANRLVEIRDDLAEDEDERIFLSERSVALLIAFLEEHPIVSKPMLATSPIGHLMAKWVWDSGKLTVHFFPDGTVEYFLFSPNPIHKEKRDVDSSHTTADALGIKLQRHGILDHIRR